MYLLVGITVVVLGRQRSHEIRAVSVGEGFHLLYGSGAARKAAHTAQRQWTKAVVGRGDGSRGCEGRVRWRAGEGGRTGAVRGGGLGRHRGARGSVGGWWGVAAGIRR